jgi:putative ABC transport system permease protein
MRKMPGDLVHLMRSLRRAPASAGAAILTLALTLGVGTSIFAVAHTALLTPPPFHNPEAVVLAGETRVDEPSAAPRPVSYATFTAWRERSQSLALLEAIDGTNLTLTGFGPAQRLSANNVTPGLLTLLGVVPALGRTFRTDDVGQPVAIVSLAFWEGTLAGDPDVVGRQIVLGGQSHTIVGVLAELFVFELNPGEVWRPLPAPAAAVSSGYRVKVIGRLGPNVSTTSVGAVLNEVTRTSSPAARAVVIPLTTATTGDAAHMLGLLAAGAAAAILIAFTNLAGLLIVRGLDRRRELAVRSALGARRSEIAKQLLLEAQALVTAGAIAGVLLSLWMAPAVGRLVLDQFDGLGQREVEVHWPVIAVVAAAASICAWICALVPALMATRRSIPDILRRGATPPPRELRLRRVFVVGEVALAFVLLVSVTLLGRDLLSLLNVNPGFDPRGVLALQVSVPAAAYNEPRVVSFYSALQHAVDERLGHGTTAIVNEVPLTGSAGPTVVGVVGSDATADAVSREASPAYFNVMRIPLLAGRAFDTRDNAFSPARVVVSDSLARRLFGTSPPIGRQIWLDAGGQMADIVGIVGDVKHRSLDEPVLPTLYLSVFQSPSRSNVLVVRTDRPDGDVIEAVREEVSRLDSSLPVYRVRSLRDVVAHSPGMVARRVLTATFSGFAVLAVVLGAVGLYGVVAHDVASRRAETALRIALGADPKRIVSAILGQGALMLGLGLATGGVLSIWTARALGSVRSAPLRLDLVSVLVPATVLIVAGVAAVLPAARRAARTDPLSALRSE